MKRIALLLCLVMALTILAGCGTREIGYDELTTRAKTSAQLARHKNFSCVYSNGVARGSTYVDRDICIVDMSDNAMAYLPDGRGFLAQKMPDGAYSVLPIVNLVNPALADKTAYEMFASVYASPTENIQSQSISDGKLSVQTKDTLGIAWEYVLDAGTLDLISVKGTRDGEEVAQEWNNYKYDVETPESKQELLTAISALEGLSGEESWVLTIVTVDDKGRKKETAVKLKNGSIAYVALGQNCGYSGLYADEKGEVPVDIYSELDKMNDVTVYAVYGK